MQPFPSAVSTEESDPFLMCDFFGPSLSHGVETDPDVFPVNWHPHRGMDIATYLIEGRGRHADSMGNRESFDSPGMQWCSVGSGIEHAEAGGTPAGINTTGFQIWINVPSDRKMDDPRYGTVSPSELPVIVSRDANTRIRVLAGEIEGAEGLVRGPFRTVQNILMLDAVFTRAGSTFTHQIAPHFDCVMVYVYNGEVSVNGSRVGTHNIALLDAQTRDSARALSLASDSGSCMVFAGTRLNQPVAWHGPFVMTTQAEIRKVLDEYRRGDFPPCRVPWDYRSLAAFPSDHPARRGAY
eukprot:gnl/Spiro4/13753_TR7341_c0_g1_i1.p1 gnl/Spiro4/13753_TR7341_c0_g1~~gnl/Spiro4/13753_TR7341_c0_g1_i1.p1  ORF type:complete len:296 (+),score=56.41 gnl/Spiro4/13753_TR7341_c0_g1_i1:124-1011(+)